MGQRAIVGWSKSEDDSRTSLPYGDQSFDDLQRLASERSLALTRRQGLLQADKASLVSLLKAYDAGMQAAGGKTGTCDEILATCEWERQVSGDEMLVAEQVITAPGPKGMDIGGTLVKVALTFPKDDPMCSLPESFGMTGRTRPDLEFDFCLGGGTGYQLKFISGGTSHIEESIQRVRRHREVAKQLEELDTPLGANAQDSSEPEPETSPQPAVHSYVHTDGDQGYSDAKGAEGAPDKSPRVRSQSSAARRRFRQRLSSSDSILSELSIRPVHPDSIHCSGGGAHKFSSLFQQSLGLTLQPVKELQAVVEGFLFMNAYGKHSNSLFTIDKSGNSIALPWPAPLYPFILVNMGSGVSILQVNSAKENDFVRVGGTACGGSTFLGLARALTSAGTFAEALKLAETGDAKKCDLLVQDIYGDDGSASLGLPGSLTAANFGKLCETPGHDANLCTEHDTARALLQMVTQQSVLLSSAYAKQAGCVDRVFFVGGFVEEENYLARVAIAENFRSLGGCAYFLQHCDYLGALGSLRACMRRESASPRCG